MSSPDHAAVEPAPAETPTVAEAAARVRANVGRVIVGKDDAVTLLLVALFVEGHCLLEDVPGRRQDDARQGPRPLARPRVPADPVHPRPPALGRHRRLGYFNQKSRSSRSAPGRVFANVLLADEINRATPRDAVGAPRGDGGAAGDRRRRDPPRSPAPSSSWRPQNPIELEGTFPLPEAQLDRFLLRVSLGYPSRDEERLIARRFQLANPLDDARAGPFARPTCQP